MRATKGGSGGAGGASAALVLGHSMGVGAPGMEPSKVSLGTKGGIGTRGGLPQPGGAQGAGGGAALPAGGLGLCTPVRGAHGPARSPGGALPPGRHPCRVAPEVEKGANPVLPPWLQDAAGSLHWHLTGGGAVLFRWPSPVRREPSSGNLTAPNPRGRGAASRPTGAFSEPVPPGAGWVPQTSSTPLPGTDPPAAGLFSGGTRDLCRRCCWDVGGQRGGGAGERAHG